MVSGKSMCWGTGDSENDQTRQSEPGHPRQQLPSLEETLHRALCHVGASLVTQTVKNLPAMQETRVWRLGWEDPLEKGMGTHPSIPAWRLPWTEEPGGLEEESMGLQRVRHDWATNTGNLYAMLAKTGVHLYSGNTTTELDTTCGK